MMNSSSARRAANDNPIICRDPVPEPDAVLQLHSTAAPVRRQPPRVRRLREVSVPRRGLRREEAAVYVGISPSKFDQLVKDERMPRPKRVDGLAVWDKHALDYAFDALPEDGGCNSGWD
jgi:predicted DNA-binding transcriptional regulator AlpA